MLTIKTLEAAIDEAVKRVKRPSEMGAVIAAVAARELVKELGQVEGRLRVLEQRRSLAWAGAYDVSRGYHQDDLVQRGAGLWVALTETRAGDMPGSSANWRRIAESRA